MQHVQYHLKSSFLGNNAAIKEYPGIKRIKKNSKIVLINVSLNFGVKIIITVIIVIKKINIRSMR